MARRVENVARGPLLDRMTGIHDVGPITAGAQDAKVRMRFGKAWIDANGIAISGNRLHDPAQRVERKSEIRFMGATQNPVAVP